MDDPYNYEMLEEYKTDENNWKKMDLEKIDIAEYWDATYFQCPCSAEISIIGGFVRCKKCGRVYNAYIVYLVDESNIKEP